MIMQRPHGTQQRDVRMIDFAIEFFDDNAVKSYCATRDGEQFGPKLTFRSENNLKKASIKYSGKECGTQLQWMDTGYLLGAGYASPFFKGYYIDRDGAVKSLGLALDEFTIFDTNHKFDIQTTSKHFPEIIDVQAEETWSNKHGSNDRFSVFEPRYAGAFRGSGGRIGPTVTFWDSGLVRTISQWDGRHIVGTRSCFKEDGYLWCEQTFAWDGSYTGNWTNRYFGWLGNRFFLDRVEVFRFWKHFKTIEGHSVKSLLDEVGLDRYTDPLVDHLIEYRRTNVDGAFVEIGPIDVSRFLI